MSDFEKSTIGDFYAETEKGARPLFQSDEVTLTKGFQADLGEYWQGLGKQFIPSDEWPGVKNVWLSVYVPEVATVGQHELDANDRKYRASYAVGTFADFVTYFSTTGLMTLDVVPSDKDPRLEGRIEFTGKLQNGEQTVIVTKGEFKFSGLTKDLPGTPAKE
ncbi:hypothetical protein [Pseudomonas neuropathica]|uniref:hypothetical protein n=1 Tax=Pseudomonas neuropathica TaxID=2730425 RepID=UPI003EB92A1A